jgi:hypothetical protein
MKRFSERIGETKPRASGPREISITLRIALWNYFHPMIFENDTTFHGIVVEIWRHLDLPSDEVPEWPYGDKVREMLKQQWLSLEWERMYGVIELCADLLAPDIRFGSETRESWYRQLNDLLDSEGCAYRFLDEQLAPITNPHEIAEVHTASECAIVSVSEHIREALNQLPPNPKASPRISVKESITAVEAAFKNLTDSPSVTFQEGLRAFEAKYGPLNRVQKVGFEKLYGYTNGPDGIRHAMVDDAATEVTLADARFYADCLLGVL